MGKGDRSSSATRSRSPQDGETQLSGNIPTLFRTLQWDPQPSSQASSHSMRSASCSPDHVNHSQANTASPTASTAQFLCLHDLQNIASDIKSTLSAAIGELRLDIQAVAVRLERVEATTSRQENAIAQVQQVSDHHSFQLREMNRHLEDLDNRAGRHNIRVRDLTETVHPSNLQQCMQSIFNGLLDRPHDSPIEIEHIHRALRPRGRDSNPPRNVICCLVNFPLKEKILKWARERCQILHEGSAIKLFQDLSPITLQHRKDLHPLMDILRSRNISYRWKFPFCLSASAMGRRALLRVPEDVQQFCNALNIPIPHLPDWCSEHRISAPWNADHREDPMEWNAQRPCRQRSPPTTPPPQTRRHPANGSPSASPAHRRSHQEA